MVEADSLMEIDDETVRPYQFEPTVDESSTYESLLNDSDDSTMRLVDNSWLV